MKSFKNKHALVTGAGSGIGRLMALGLAREGAFLALVDVNKPALAAVEAEVHAAGAKAFTYACDISDRATVAKTCGMVRRDLGHLDILINNAGTVVGKSFLDLSVEEMERTMQINYWGHTYFTKQFLGEMLERPEANIVNVASSSGLLGMPMLTDYAASKFAEVGFSEALRRELRKFGKKNLTVTVVCPYTIDTGMFRGFKPMLMSPLLKPEYAASAILKGVRKNKPYVMLPPLSIRSSMFMKLFPVKFFDWMLAATGGERAMDHFVGRKKG
jgi:all-trans-retinol dehydrogenase (NAD+)